MEANIMGVHGGEFRACPISASVHCFGGRSAKADSPCFPESSELLDQPSHIARVIMAAEAWRRFPACRQTSSAAPARISPSFKAA
jgi:hypothetical protein